MSRNRLITAIEHLRDALIAVAQESDEKVRTHLAYDAIAMLDNDGELTKVVTLRAKPDGKSSQ